MKNAVVLWTGGKDSCLSLHLAREKFKIVALATFVPKDGAEFKAHPRAEMKRQAQRLGLDLHFVEVSEPFRESYILGLKWLRTHLNADVVITGDIDLVDGFPNWIDECCQGLDIDVFRPLWGKDRNWIMDQVLAIGIRARITWINHPQIPRTWLNREIDEDFLFEMRRLCSECIIDLAGENGEYHTMVIDSPKYSPGEE